jgi:hypothetical protein
MQGMAMTHAKWYNEVCVRKSSSLATWLYDRGVSGIGQNLKFG